MKKLFLVLVFIIQLLPVHSQPDSIDIKNYNRGSGYDFIINNKKYNIISDSRIIYKYFQKKAVDSCILFDFNQFINKENYNKGLLLKNNIFSFYKMNIDSVENNELKVELKKLFETGNGVEKVQVISLLSAINKYIS
ncbi:MAG: hypothetical protein KAT68_07605 [Bacteroidales bacterium]|nr:hypothetical protein [Bacteroidales bacterium]